MLSEKDKKQIKKNGGSNSNYFENCIYKKYYKYIQFMKIKFSEFISHILINLQKIKNFLIWNDFLKLDISLFADFLDNLDILLLFSIA